MATTMTPAVHERLTADLDLLNAKRVELTDAMAASGRGDEADMAQTSLAREEIARLDLKIRELRIRLVTATVAERSVSGDVVARGSLVEVLFAGDTDPELYLVSDHGDVADGATTISPSSPLGEALLGRSAGDEAAYSAPAGRLQVRIRAVR